MASINKKLPGAVALGSDMVIPRRFTSGSLSLDVALGGGWPGNKWVEIIGRESMGKTACIYKTIAANQLLDPEFSVFWLAAEHYDVDQAAALGVDNDRVSVAATQHMELALDYLLDATESKAFDLIVCDSFPALTPEEEAEKAMNEYTVGAGARKFNQFWRKMGAASHRAYDGSQRPFIGLMVNQWRDKVGGFSPRGTPQTSPGGHQKDFSYYARVDLTRVDWITEKRPGVKDPVKVGQTIKFKTIKNKSAAPQQTAETDFFFRPAPLLGFRRGEYDTAKEYVTMAILFGVIERRGAYYYYEGEQWSGKDAVQAAIREDKGLQEKIAAKVLEIAADPARVNSVVHSDIQAASGTRRVSRRAA